MGTQKLQPLDHPFDAVKECGGTQYLHIRLYEFLPKRFKNFLQECL